MAVHGDDFVSEGKLADLQWVEAQLKQNFQIKTELVGADPRLLKEVKLLNRVLTWSEEGIYWEPDMRHVELTLQDIGLDDDKASFGRYTRDQADEPGQEA